MFFYIGFIVVLVVFFRASKFVDRHSKKTFFLITKGSKKPTMQNETPFKQVEQSGQHPPLKHKKLFVLTLVLLVVGLVLLIGAVVIERPRGALFDGSKEDNGITPIKAPIEISSIRALHNIGLKSDLPLDGVYLLTGDIDASETASWYGGAGFRPVGSLEKPFAGSLDGQGHSIRNLVINRPDADNIGLFGVVAENAAITKVQLVDARVTGYFNVGSLIGSNRGAVSKCSGTGNVTGEAYLGGLLGANAGQATQCYAMTAVTGESRLGALVGMNTGAVKECYGGGKISGKAYFGGLIGRNQGGTVLSSFWDITSTGIKNSEGGTGQETPVMMTRRPYAESGWDFTTTWEIAEGSSYPQLAARPTKEVDSMPSGIEIDSIDQLQRIGREENLPLDGNYRLSSDVDARATAAWDEGRGFEPVGTVAGGKPPLPFTGRLDGQGHVILGLAIHRPESNDVGLFTALGQDAQVVNLGLQDISVTGNNNVGGLGGQNYGSVSSCFMKGNIEGNAYVGGLVGIQNGKLDKCYAMGAIKGDSRVGGLTGMNQGAISESLSAAAVRGASLTGALVGRNYRDGTVAENCFWDRTLCAVNLPGDSAGRSTAEMFQQATYAAKAWDFTQVWKITEGKSYPALRVFP